VSSSIKMVVAVPPGSYSAGDTISIESHDLARWVPAQVGDYFVAKLIPAEVFPSLEIRYARMVVRFYDSSGNLLHEQEVGIDPIVSAKILVPSGTVYIDIEIVEKRLQATADLYIAPDSVNKPDTPPEIIRFEMQDSEGNVLDSASILLGAGVSGITTYYYATVVAQNPYVEISVSTTETLSYIDKLVMTITKVVGTPGDTDYVEMQLLDAYKYLVNSCKIQPIYAYYSCACAVTQEISWIKVLLSSQVAGLSVTVKIEERVRGFI